MTTTRLWLPLPKWDGQKWMPLGPKLQENDWEQQVLEWPSCVNTDTLPQPRFRLGDRVRFRWSDGFLTGEIRKITLQHGGTVAWEYRENPQAQYNAINYEIYANGHGRSVWDYGNLEIDFA